MLFLQFGQVFANHSINSIKTHIVFQFIDHDITLGLNTRGIGDWLDYQYWFVCRFAADSGEGLACCSRNNNGQLVQHSACKPIMVPANDEFYTRYNHTCLNFVRNVAAPPNHECTLGELLAEYNRGDKLELFHLGPREQSNAVTHFIDGSHIYGSDEKRMKDVRSFRDGMSWLMRFAYNWKAKQTLHYLDDMHCYYLPFIDNHWQLFTRKAEGQQS